MHQKMHSTFEKRSILLVLLLIRFLSEMKPSGIATAPFMIWLVAELPLLVMVRLSCFTI